MAEAYLVRYSEDKMDTYIALTVILLALIGVWLRQNPPARHWREPLSDPYRLPNNFRPKGAHAVSLGEVMWSVPERKWPSELRQ